MKAILQRIQNFCLSIREFKTTLASSAPAMPEVTARLTSLNNEGWELQSEVNSLQAKQTTIASDFKRLANKIGGLQNGASENLLSVPEIQNMVAAITRDEALAIYNETNRLGSLLQEVMVEQEVPTGLAVSAGKFSSFQELAEAEAAAKANQKKEVVTTHVLREGKVESSDAYNEAALRTISANYLKTQTQLRNAAKKITNVATPEVGDRVAVNYGDSQSPGDWWPGTVAKVGTGSLQVSFDSEPDVPHNFTMKEAMGSTFMKLNKSAPKGKLGAESGMTYKAASKYASEEVAEKNLSTVVVVEHVSIVPGMPAKRPPPYDDKWLKQNNATQTIVSLPGQYYEGTGETNNDEVGFIVLNEQRVMMFHEDAAQYMGSEIDSKRNTNQNQQAINERSKKLRAERKPLEKTLEKLQTQENDLIVKHGDSVLNPPGAKKKVPLTQTKKDPDTKEDVEVDSDKMEAIRKEIMTDLATMRNAVKDRKALTTKLNNLEDKDRERETPVIEKQISMLEKRMADLRKKNKDKSELFRKLDAIQTDIFDTIEAIEKNQDEQDKLRERQIQRNAAQQAPTSEHESGYALANKVLDQLNAKTTDKYVLVSPNAKRGLPPTLLCYWIATEHEYDLLLSNFGLPADANGVLEWQFLKPTQATAPKSGGAGGKTKTYNNL